MSDDPIARSRPDETPGCEHRLDAARSPRPPRRGALARVISMLGIAVVVIAFVVFRVWLSERRPIPPDVLARAISVRFAQDPSLLSVLCEQPVRAVDRVVASEISTNGGRRAGSGTALVSANAIGLDGNYLASGGCRRRIRFEYFSDRTESQDNGRSVVVVQAYNITRAGP